MTLIALVTGITGQDGSYLTEFLLTKGYVVHGIIRSRAHTSLLQTVISNPLYSDRLFLHLGDMLNQESLLKAVQKFQPDEIYNLAAQSHVQESFFSPEYTTEVIYLGTIKLLEIIKSQQKKIKFYQASSSEIFGQTNDPIQNENSKFCPQSPYAVAKLSAYWMVRNYREGYKIFATNGILFNHESPRRGADFVTRKISIGVAKIKLKISDCLYLGNLNAKRDWGHARDYVEAMWQMMQLDVPGDFVIATGETHSVREFVEVAFKVVDINIRWEGTGENEIGINDSTGELLVKVDKKFYRPNEVDALCGDYSLATNTFGWRPRVSFQELVTEMVLGDLKNGHPE